MRSSDIVGVGELAGAALSAGGALIAEMHAGIAERAFGSAGHGAMSAREIHDRISTAVYTGVRAGLSAGALHASRLAAARAQESGPALGSQPVGSFLLGALNGLYGDHLHKRGSTLALPLGIRRHGETVPATPDALATAFPAATGRVVVFVHGLCETDEAWRLAQGDRDDRRSYGERLHEDLAFTPVYLRYNTGLHVSDNGRALSRLLDELVEGWPVEIEELALVGHSMGGLVARSACHYGGEFRHVVRHVFCLGSPHLGADLEKGANMLASALHRIPETRALGKLLNARSVGIKDMRFGSCVEEDWCDCDADEFMRDRCREVPFLPGANYYFVASTLMAGPVGTLLGDLVVRLPSASGRGTGKGRRIPFEVDNGCELTGLNHLHLLNHPAVYEQLHRWLGG
jgi:pimeloyl-ACP methyl ester carboxylesterase